MGSLLGNLGEYFLGTRTIGYHCHRKRLFRGFFGRDHHESKKESRYRNLRLLGDVVLGRLLPNVTLGWAAYITSQVDTWPDYVVPGLIVVAGEAMRVFGMDLTREFKAKDKHRLFSKLHYELEDDALNRICDGAPSGDFPLLQRSPRNRIEQLLGDEVLRDEWADEDGRNLGAPEGWNPAWGNYRDFPGDFES